MTLRQTRMLLTLAALWGASFLFIRVAVDDLGPVALADARLLLAAVALVPFVIASARPSVPLRRYLLLGAVNAALPFTLIALAETRIDASLAAILNASTPLFAAVVAAVVGDEPFTARRAFGLALGIGGVALVVGLAHVDADWAFVGAAACSLGAALCYALGSTYVKHRMAGESTGALALFQQLAGGLVLLPLVAAFPPHRAPDGGEIAAVAGLAVAATSLAFLIYFRLLAEIGPTSTLTVTFLVPVFGVLWATIFLGEKVTGGTLAGAALILASVGFVAGAFSRRPAPPPVPAPAPPSP
jgi:drug/metabolite transporter (DMT)-like permease